MKEENMNTRMKKSMTVDELKFEIYKVRTKAVKEKIEIAKLKMLRQVQGSSIQPVFEGFSILSITDEIISEACEVNRTLISHWRSGKRDIVKNQPHLLIFITELLGHFIEEYKKELKNLKGDARSELKKEIQKASGIYSLQREMNENNPLITDEITSKGHDLCYRFEKAWNSVDEFLLDDEND